MNFQTKTLIFHGNRVLAKGDTPIAAVEIKFSSTPDVAKGFYQVIEDLGTTSNFVITPHSDDYPLKAQIEVTSLRSFLRYHLPRLLKPSSESSFTL